MDSINSKRAKSPDILASAPEALPVVKAAISEKTNTPNQTPNPTPNLTPNLTPNQGLSWKTFVDWLYVPNDFLGLTRSLTGLEALLVLMIVWVWSHGGPGPVNVPAWRIGPHLLSLPMPPPSITGLAFFLGTSSAVAMLCGLKQKLWPLILALVIGYFGSVDWVACGLHFIVLEWIMLVAFLFARPGRSPTRRLIQISIVACYFYTATQKLCFPDFVAGYSLETIFGDGWSLGSAWRGVLPVEKFGHGFWAFSSWMTIALEYFFAVGLCFPKTRKIAAVIAILFHFGISIFLDKFITIFSLVMWAGLTTFLDLPASRQSINEAQKEAQNEAQSNSQSNGESLAQASPENSPGYLQSSQTPGAPKFSVSAYLEQGLVAVSDRWQKLDNSVHAMSSSLGLSFIKKSTERELRSQPVPLSTWIKMQSLLASVLIAMMVFIPVRVFFYPGRPVDKLSFFDRSPWSYCMYLARQETYRLDATYQDEHGDWHPHVIDKKRDRWGKISCDNETYALANYVFKVHPDARRVRIENEILLNGHLPQEKVLERARDDHDQEVQVRFLPPYPEIRLQKREDGKGSADF